MEVDLSPNTEWGPAKRFAFRMAAIYFFLFCLPFPIGEIPKTESWAVSYERLWQTIVPWVGKHLLQLKQEITIFTNGSGDTTYNYVQALCYGVIALAGAIAWSILDRKRLRYSRTFDWIRVYVRFALATTMLSYGMSKVIPLQFQPPSLGRLMQPYGDSSPMGLLWTFMGYSTAYNIFTGAAEVLGGVLLFFRRTTTLGALITFAVMINIVMLNFCFDVPVKLFSLHLLAMTVFLLLPDLQRLANLLILNRPTAAAVLGRPFDRRWLDVSARILGVLFAGYICYSITRASISQYHALQANPPNALSGLYDVEEFTRAGQAVPPTITESKRWRRITISNYGTVSIRMMDDTRERFLFETDPQVKSISLVTQAHPDAKASFVITRPDADRIVLDGTWENAPTRITLHKAPDSSFLLTSRPFRWIQEEPFNR